MNHIPPLHPLKIMAQYQALKLEPKMEKPFIMDILRIQRLKTLMIFQVQGILPGILIKYRIPMETTLNFIIIMKTTNFL